MKKLVCLILNVYIFTFVTFSQELPTDIKFTTYTRTNGLPEERLNNVKEDSRGFLWIGSNEGLFRFDGKNYKSWYANSADSTTFNSNSVFVKGEYKKGYMLFTTPKLWQINIYNQKIEKLPSFKNKGFIYAVIKINATQWFVSDLDSLYITDAALNIKKTFEVAKYYPPKTAVNCFPLHYPYVLLYPASQMKLYLLNYVTNEIKPFNMDVQLNKNSPFAFPKFYDSIAKRLYLSAFFDGNFYMDLQIPTVTNYIPKSINTYGDASTRSVLLLNPKLVLQGGDVGLNVSNFEKNILFNNNTPTDKPMTAASVADIYKDSKENIWVSTANGLNRFSFKPPIISYLKNELHFKTKDAFIEILKGPDGNIYFLTLNKSLYRLNKKNNSVTRLDSSIGYTWSAIVNKNTLIATGGGKRIVVYDIATGKTSNPTYLNPFYGTADLVTLVFKAKNGDVWYSINAGGGLVCNPNGTTKYIHYFNGDNPSAFSHRHLHCAAEDSKGNIWFGYERNPNLLKWVSSLQKFEEYPVNSLIKNFNGTTGIVNLLIDSKDNLWIVLGGMSLLRYNIITKTGKHYDMNDGLPTESISGLCEDGKGRLWVSTTKGLSCYLAEKEKFTTFTTSDGLPEDKFTNEGIFYDKEQQLIYVGAETSIAWFNPDSLLQKAIKEQPPLFIDEMHVNGKKYFFDNEKNIQLNSSENNIEFTIAVADFFRNDQLVFQYKLKGASNNWIDLGANRTITFNNLPSGKYEFSVRSKYQGNDEWVETTFPFAFKIATPWNYSWWFILLSIAFFAFVLWYIIRQYYLRKLDNQKAIVEKQQAVQDERNRIATDMHDDLGSGLTKITYLSQMAKSSKDKNEDLEKINKTSTELVENMSEIIWAMKEENNSLTDLIQHIKNYAIQYCADNNLKCQINFANNYNERIVKGENRRNVFLAIKEILHNIVKHANATSVIITANYDKDWLVHIIDNGIGINTAMEQKAIVGNGLKNIKKRIAAVGGTVSFENSNGTKVILHISI
jgi:signal transduction histidine kinase/ligand-binding sensor domain-containing protein